MPGTYLVRDMSVECFVGEHAMMTAVGITFQVLYIVGIPAGMFVVLYRKRQALHDKNHPDNEKMVFSYGGLYTYVSCLL